MLHSFIAAATMTPFGRFPERTATDLGRDAIVSLLAESGVAPADIDGLLRLFVLDKAMYELGYELNNRPDWAHIPMIGLLRLPGSLHA